MNQEKYLERLIGKVVAKTDLGTSTTIPIGNNKDDFYDEIFSITLQVYFEDYLLNIYNPISIVPSDKELSDFVGLKVIGTDEAQKKAEIIFDNGYRLSIDMRDEVYYDPEAMSLHGPDNFCAVWN